MPSYIVTLDPKATEDQVKSAEKHATDQGGKIGHRYATTFKGFSVSFDNDAVTTLEKAPHVESVQLDGEVKTQ